MPVACLVRPVFGLQVLVELLDVRLGRALDGEARNRWLESLARFEYLARLLGRGRRHEGAAVRVQLDNFAARQQQKTAPDPHPAHAEGIAQGRLGQLGAGRKALFDNGLENPLDDVLLAGFVGHRCPGNMIVLKHHTLRRTRNPLALQEYSLAGLSASKEYAHSPNDFSRHDR